MLLIISPVGAKSISLTMRQNLSALSDEESRDHVTSGMLAMTGILQADQVDEYLFHIMIYSGTRKVIYFNENSLFCAGMTLQGKIKNLRRIYIMKI